jgi:hypothetical protein
MKAFYFHKKYTHLYSGAPVHYHFHSVEFTQGDTLFFFLLRGRLHPRQSGAVIFEVTVTGEESSEILRFFFYLPLSVDIILYFGP